MADNTNLTVYEQYNMKRSCDALMASAGLLLRTVEQLKREKDQFVALGLNALIDDVPQVMALTDRVHKDGNAPTKGELLDISSLVDYIRKTILADGTASTMTAAQARVILDRYAAG